jgi:5-methylcytosine-specific restriction endonuclease McrA
MGWQKGKSRKHSDTCGCPWCIGGFRQGFDSRRIKFGALKKAAIRGREMHYKNQYDKPWEELTKYMRREHVLNDQQRKCLWCNRNNWRKNPLVLEIDHIDGNTNNWNRNNLRILCPNCHSQTPTWRKSWKNKQV